MDRLDHFKAGSKIYALAPPPAQFLGYFPNWERLTTGAAYTIAKVDMQPSHVTIEVEELPGLLFNVCSFRFGEDSE